MAASRARINGANVSCRFPIAPNFHAKLRTRERSPPRKVRHQPRRLIERSELPG